jgi:hypothetical protein
MTMSREAKAGHEMILKGQWPTPEFQHPRLRAEAKASRGTAQMTTAEYATHKMGRMADRVSPSLVREAKAEAQIRARRAAGRTRRG